MSRKKLKNRRRKDRAQRKILITAVCIAAVIIGVGIGGHVIKKNAGKTMTTAETESKKAVSKKKATAKKLTINENETDASNKENQGQKIRQMTEVNLQFNQEEKWGQQNNRMKKLSI